ncbi:sarcosine oxidase subunit alpha family protein [Nisaea acidiphila]|uniref:Sarcosine oxidase subunit alpha family protein n=1 Tax=Nisaea acidiphila TaxID=1862145 RepID=A0A9J7AVE3_9PROT|nr:sarcosine oxidase subunit alpha family protein [Nisaea acidiphila]UUX50433.1 sarcosine oxidase subunit alpha family protein [Nisaea acidiphila]
MMRGKEQQPFRISSGGEVERTRPLKFSFDGKSYTGYQGDTLASALLANGVRLVGRSFKYHRPRGIYSAGPEEPNALVHLRSGGRQEPNTRATQIELFAGLEAKSQNRWPNLRFDLMGVNELASRFLVAGFYYKTFMGLPGWHFYEHFIRKAAGMGAAEHIPDPDTYDNMHGHADIVVIGAGPAGLAAARQAGESGARVFLIDENDRPGGRLRAERETVDGRPAMDWADETVAALESMENVTLLTRTTAFGYYDGDTIGAVERISDHLLAPAPHTVRQRRWLIHAKKVLLATGATERPLVFDGNDRPGIMLAGAARTYANRFAVQAGKQAVIFANSDDGYRTALDLANAGIEVRGVIDPRKGGQSALKSMVTDRGIDILEGAAVVRTHGYLGLAGVDIADLDALRSGAMPEIRNIPCDLLAVGGGWSPNVHLHSHQSGKPVYDPGIAAFVPGASRMNDRSIGAARGRFGLGACLADGFEAGREAAEELGFAVGVAPGTPKTEEPAQGPFMTLWEVPALPGRKGRSFVDLQDDVAASDVELAEREGYVSVEHLKRYTTLGMGTDQGKTSNINGHALLAEARGVDIAAVGTTTFRPPYTPVAIGAFAGRERGRHAHPVRRTPMHDWHLENGAQMIEAGLWMRPQYYLQDGETASRAAMDKAITRETLAVRNAAGISDVSTLGKIDIQGTDAAEFLNRIYINGWKTLPVGKARYGVMLREDGVALDDGTTSRIGENHYFMTTTTAEAGPVMQHLELHLQVHWPDLDVKVSSVTDAWAAMAIAGPNSRAVLSALFPETDFSNDAFPFMGVRDASLGGIPARIFRISFSGEMAYEIAVPADYGRTAWERCIEAGAGHGLLPYGMEALGILRIEKGHVTVSEVDGRHTATDLGFGKMMSSKKRFVGDALATRECMADPSRPRLVGLTPVDGKTKIRAGSVLVADPKTPPPVPKLGHVSSTAYLSPNLGVPLSLGMLKNGPERIGETVWAVFPLRNEAVECRITSPVVYDEEGARLHG